MLTERFKITLEAVAGELADLKSRFRASRKVLVSQRRMLRDQQTGQGHLLPMGALASGATLGQTEEAINSLGKLNSLRKRHLNALRRVIQDELSERAEAAQLKLPTEDNDEDCPETQRP